MEADLHHFPLPRLLSGCDQCFWVPDYRITRMSRTHFCLFSPPCQREPVAKGSTVPTQRAAASWSCKCLKPAVLKSTQVLPSRTDLLQAHWHDAYNPHVQRDIPNPRGMQIHPSHCPPMPPPMHLLIPHTRLHLLVWMLLRLTRGQYHQQPCPFPCSAPARDRSPDHKTAADITRRQVQNCQQPLLPNVSLAN